MAEMHLKQPGFTYSACRPFTKDKERIQKFKETGDKKSIFTKMNLIKLVFNMIWHVEILVRRTASDKVSRDKAFNIVKSPKYDGYQRKLASMVYYFFDKKPAGSGVTNNKIKQNMQLAKELRKPIIRNFKKRRVYSGFKDNI